MISTVPNKIVTKFWLNLIFVFFGVLFGSDVGYAQAKSNAILNPPDWILGSWGNLAESNSNNFETFTFILNKISFFEGVRIENKATDFSEKFKGYEIKESIESKLYQVEFAKGAATYIYEFKICEDCYVSSAKETALTYSVRENKRVVREHSKSANFVLIRRSMPKIKRIE